MHLYSLFTKYSHQGINLQFIGKFGLQIGEDEKFDINLVISIHLWAKINR